MDQWTGTSAIKSWLGAKFLFIYFSHFFPLFLQGIRGSFFFITTTLRGRQADSIQRHVIQKALWRSRDLNPARKSKSWTSMPTWALSRRWFGSAEEYSGQSPTSLTWLWVSEWVRQVYCREGGQEFFHCCCICAESVSVRNSSGFTTPNTGTASQYHSY